MTRRPNFLKLSAALATLTTPAALATNVAATPTVPDHKKANDTARPQVTMRVGEDFMRFTVSDNGQGIAVAQHESHSSHSSHASHASHASGM